jgi:signal transduction histidine kinase
VAFARDHTRLVHFAVPLILDGQRLGAVLAGQVFDQYPEPAVLAQVAGQLGLAPARVWQKARLEVLVKRDTLRVYADLLEHLSQGFLHTRFDAMQESERLVETTRLRDLAKQGRFEAMRAEAEVKRQHATLEAHVRVRQHLEAQLRQTQKMEALGTLAGGIAHEFNNILAALLGFATLLHREVPPESRAGLYVQQVRQAGNRAKELVQQILTFSRAESLAREPLQLDRVVQEALTLLRASLPSTVDIQYHISEPGMMVQANRTQLHEVIMNLGANADSAMRESGGRLTVRVDLVEVDAAFATAYPPLSPGRHVCLTVDDTGSGMTAEVMRRIFEPFFTTKSDGMGMGLMFCRSIVEAHGGRLWATDNVPRGAIFQFTLPDNEDSTLPTAGRLR